jgi:hypothetical protein
MVFLCGDSFRLASDIEKARSALQRSSGGTPEEHAGLLDMEKVERAGRRLNEAMCSFVVEKIGGDIPSFPFGAFLIFSSRRWPSFQTTILFQTLNPKP